MSDTSEDCLKHDELKLCINCKHSKSYAGQKMCKHPDSTAWVISLVDGKTAYVIGETWSPFCDNNRNIGNACGVEGKYFEQKEKTIMKIALIGRKSGQSDSAHKNLQELIIKFSEAIIARWHYPFFEEETAKSFIKGTHLETWDQGDYSYASFSNLVSIADLAIVMGGDGSMLNAAKALSSSSGVQSIPILGINLGRVGFITDVPHDFDPDLIITMLEKNDYTIEKRTMLALRGPTKPGLPGWKAALNDVVISRSTGKIIEFHVSIDGERAYTARGDGLMVSTPTGSTAYALSGGGPIIHPTARVIEILPIMAQSLSCRPLIINDTSSVGFELISGDAEIYVDGNPHLEMKPGEHLEVSRADRKVEFIHPKMKELTYSYYNTLAEKLNWHHLPGTPRS